ncbi:uncharacterized protein CTRU02_215739 [Colletotrichum truncatum]|uniref:Uncharacterized protein n=1 Tax=Colletotrichum truncatum TaxID=5467 RepID=A0ACC3YBS0_COLTU
MSDLGSGCFHTTLAKKQLSRSFIPFFVGVQDLIDRNSFKDDNVPRRGANITTRFFLSHVYTVSTQLCDAAPDGLSLSLAELPEDIALLCHGLYDAVANLFSLWAAASATLAISWLSSFELTICYLREAIRTSPPPLDIDADAFPNEDHVFLEPDLILFFQNWDRAAKAISWWGRAQLRRTQMERNLANSEIEKY